jgi:hypothetical protein
MYQLAELVWKSSWCAALGAISDAANDAVDSCAVKTGVANKGSGKLHFCLVHPSPLNGRSGGSLQMKNRPFERDL